ncbi:MAG TPA: GNAT family N-acetyltransferase [Stellaceae bacterium]|nr:GNAT family N-acetyltransferase [Stellaceae bacterium]
MTGTETPATSVEELTEFQGTDLNDLCDAAVAAIAEGGGFGWVKRPPRHIMEAYWKGLLLVPDRKLFVARIDGTVAGAAILVRAPRNNEAQAHAALLTGHFIAPWARGHGLSPKLIKLVEETARGIGVEVLNLDVRETQTRAIQVFESLGFHRFGTHPAYARVEGRLIAGYFYWKPLVPGLER